MSAALRFVAPLSLLLVAAAPAVQTLPPPVVVAEETKYFPEDANGPAVLESALADAAGKGKLAVIVFGADWCHDSQGLARVLRSDAFKAEFGARFQVTLIDVGTPQVGEGRNLDLVARFGVKKLKSTPALFVISPMGERINSKGDAVSWRNADSRSEAEVLAWFRKLAARTGGS